MIQLHSKKNHQYAHGGPPLGNFERVAKLMEMYSGRKWPIDSPITVAWMYLLKHFDAVMWDLANGQTPNDENLGDIAVYMNIIRCMIHD